MIHRERERQRQIGFAGAGEEAHLRDRETLEQGNCDSCTKGPHPD
ncbi:hypothetical protein DsansV1_C01g0001261 [Dioscorea sansibarensis]